MRLLAFVILTLTDGTVSAQAPVTPTLPTSSICDLDARIALVSPKVVAWRRDLYAHPESSIAEERIAGVVAAHLTALELEVRTNVGGTLSVIGVLRGGQPGPTVALRADVDALPVTELTGKRAHGAQPWRSIDPIVIGEPIVTAHQPIAIRNVDLTTDPAVLTVGAYEAGVRENIIPDSAVSVGTYRTFNETARATMASELRAIAAQCAAAGGATATVSVNLGYVTTANAASWFGRSSSMLRNTLGGTQVLESVPSMPTGTKALSALAVDALPPSVPALRPVK